MNMPTDRNHLNHGHMNMPTDRNHLNHGHMNVPADRNYLSHGHMNVSVGRNHISHGHIILSFNGSYPLLMPRHMTTSRHARSGRLREQRQWSLIDLVAKRT